MPSTRMSTCLKVAPPISRSVWTPKGPRTRASTPGKAASRSVIVRGARRRISSRFRTRVRRPVEEKSTGSIREALTNTVGAVYTGSSSGRESVQPAEAARARMGRIQAGRQHTGDMEDPIIGRLWILKWGRALRNCSPGHRTREHASRSRRSLSADTSSAPTVREQLPTTVGEQLLRDMRMLDSQS